MAGILRDPNLGPSQGRYELGDLIATGGMGSVYRAFDRLGQRQIAYKRLRVSIEAHRPRMTALFRREYDTLARLEHPNIVSVHEFGVDGFGPYYTMELVAGDDLAKRGRMPVGEACRIARDVASALALVHARRMIHRDVSPNNVKLTAVEDAKLIDFGALTAFGIPNEVVGTPQFVAPECLTHEPLDGRVDLYSLGALLYFMLTRQLAIRATSLEALPPAWEQPIPAPSQAVPEVPAALDDLVLQLLRVDREARPSSAGEVVERLTNLASLPPEQDERRVAFSYLKHAPLQGRDAQLGAITSALDALMQGRGGVLRVEGSAGSGRSALLEQIGVEAQLRGATVLRADGTVHTEPLAAALHLVRSGLAIYPELATQFRDRHSSMLIEPGRSADASEAAARHARIAASVQETLLQLGLRSPLVVLVDDAQLIDAPSLGLLASMAERVVRHPILIALTRISAPATSDAEAILQSSGSLLSLDSLSERDVRELVRIMFGGVPNALVLSRWLYEESGGNPRHCLGLVGWLLDRGKARYARGTFTLPSSIDAQADLASEEALRLDRLTRLGEGPLLLARVLALAENPLDVMQLAQASGAPPAQVIEHLRTLGEASQIVAADGEYRLLSRTLAQDVEAQISPEDRRVMHLALATTLGVELSSPAARLAAAMHLVRAGGDEALKGALQIASIVRDHQFELLVGGEIRRPLTAALEVLHHHGYDDVDCVNLLGVLSSAGFYGDLDAQRRYFDRAVQAYYKLTGLGLAVRLAPFLGKTLALLVGMVGALVTRSRKARLPRASLRESLVGLVQTIGPAVAAAACALDTPEAERAVAYLDPLSSLPQRSALQVLRNFSLAVVDTTAGRIERADAGYRRVLAELDAVKDLNDAQKQQFRDGCLHGIAEGAVEDHPAEALAAADKLATTSYFAPHAELVRMFYHGWRGERTRAEEHRARAEALALLGGAAWSAVVLINIRAYGSAVASDDMLEMVRLAAEFERIAPLSPALGALQQVAQADLLRMRGRAQEALPQYAAALGSEAGRRQPMYRINCACHAHALVECGRAHEAKKLCSELLAQTDEDTSFPLASHRFGLQQQLAFAEASLGEHAAAAARLDELIARYGKSENPLLLGTLHRDRARVALQSADLPSFDAHFAEAQAWFARTQNQWLLQQCDALLTQAVRAGLRPAAPARALEAIDDTSTEMDGNTQIGLRDTELDGATQMELRDEDPPANTNTEVQVSKPGEKSSRTG